MKCTNPEIGRLLPGFMSGEVSGEEMELFQEHMLECNECFGNFHFLLHLEDGLKKHKDTLFSKS